MPRMAAAAVSRIGRNRCSVATMTAFHGCRPAAISVSIWSIRITELRITMPISETTPRIATKPMGARDKQCSGDADEGQRCGGKHKEQPLKALQLYHEDCDHEQYHEWEHRED